MCVLNPITVNVSYSWESVNRIAAIVCKRSCNPEQHTLSLYRINTKEKEKEEDSLYEELS